MSKLGIEQKTVKQLLGDNKADFLIPDYQRPYAWEEKECQTLWDDIFTFAFPDNDCDKFDRQNDEYFLGPIVTFLGLPPPQYKSVLEQSAQAILDAGALYQDSSLADLYDETAMPRELRTAHQNNDLAVMRAYGFTEDHPAWHDENACVAELMKRYQALAEKKGG